MQRFESRRPNQPVQPPPPDKRPGRRYRPGPIGPCWLTSGGRPSGRSSVARSSFIEMDATSGAKVSASQPRIRVGRALKPVVVVFAVLYFLIDALFFGLIKPFGTWLSKFRIFSRLGRWVRSLGPYSTLALFVIPFVVAQTDWSLSHSVGTGDRRNVRHRRW
jgi:hypothetical protein